MNKLGCLIVMFITCGVCEAQFNLVPNSSFEVYDTCPNTTVQVQFAAGWSNFGNTPDYYNACATNYMSVPVNAVSYQQAADGQAYCGFILWGVNDYREFIGATLDSSLQIGKRYYVSAKFNLADGNSFALAVNKLCIRFSKINYSQSAGPPLDNFAQIVSDTLVEDTLGWYELKGSFIADSGYNHIIIGNFFQNAFTDTFSLTQSPAYAYYLVDDICVSSDSLTCNSTVGINEINNKTELILFPNPFADKLNITIKRNETVEVSLYDVTARKIFKQSFVNSISINTEQLAKGIYLYEVRNKNGVIKKGKVVKE